MGQSLDSAGLDQLFDKARTHNKWQARDVPDELLKSVVEHMKWGPTSANCSPALTAILQQAAWKKGLTLHCHLF